MTVHNEKGKPEASGLWPYVPGDQASEERAFHAALEWALRKYGDWRNVFSLPS